jgi:hypothetical protein
MKNGIWHFGILDALPRQDEQNVKNKLMLEGKG